MTRRALLLAFAAAPLFADSAEDAWAVLRSAASALAAGNAEAFLACFDPGMEGYERLRSDVVALTREAQASSSIERESNEGDDRVRTVKADWLLTAPSLRRQSVLTLRIERQRNTWRITRMDRSGFFAPPDSAVAGCRATAPCALHARAQTPRSPA